MIMPYEMDNIHWMMMMRCDNIQWWKWISAEQNITSITSKERPRTDETGEVPKAWRTQEKSKAPQWIINHIHKHRLKFFSLKSARHEELISYSTVNHISGITTTKEYEEIKPRKFQQSSTKVLQKTAKKRQKRQQPKKVKKQRWTMKWPR